jgi:hypothetical protein
VCLESTGGGFGDDVCASVGEDYGTKCGAVSGMKMFYYLTCNCPLCTWCFYHTDASLGAESGTDALFNDSRLHGEPMSCATQGSLGSDVPHFRPNNMDEQVEGIAVASTEGEQTKITQENTSIIVSH